MVVVVRCAGCGSSYRMHERLAGKKARCLCGEPLRVPAATVETEPVAEEVGQEDKPSRPAPPAGRQEEAPEDAAAGAPSPGEREKSRPWRVRRIQPLGTLVGVLSICYGGVVTLILLAELAWSFSLGVIGALSSAGSILAAMPGLVLAITITAGGVLIVMRHEHGPACAGVASGILCIFGVVPALGAAAGMLSRGSLGGFLFVLVRTAVVYCIPIGVAVWCIREEMAKQREEETDESV